MHLQVLVSIAICIALLILVLIWWGVTGAMQAAPDISKVENRSGQQILTLVLMATGSALAFAIEIGKAVEKFLHALLSGR